MHWIWIPIAAAALLLLSLAALGYYTTSQITVPRRKSFAESRDAALRQGFADSFDRYRLWPKEPFSVERNAVLLRGMYARNPVDRGARKKVAVICHGHTVSMACSVKYADLFWLAGWSIVMYDQRYFGTSDGTHSTLGLEETEDLRAVLSWTRDTFGADCRIALHGESMGGATVLNVLSKEKPELVVADCPFSDTRLQVRQLIRSTAHIPALPVLAFARLFGRMIWDYDMAKCSPIRAVEQSEVPICFLHGAEDTYVSCMHSKKMYGVCRSALSELHLFPGADHAESIVKHRQAYEAIVWAFLSKIEQTWRP